MHIQGVLIGLIALLMIGLFHPVVIRCEYHFGSRCWPVFLIAGCACLGLSLAVETVLLSATLGILGFTCFWTIIELKEQEKRVAKGWFPKKPASDGKTKKEKAASIKEITKVKE